MENTPETPISITQYRRSRAQDAAIESLILENERLRDSALPGYVLLVGANAKRLGIKSAEQAVNAALLHNDFDESRDASMCLDMCEAFLEYIEGRALAAASAHSADEQCPCGAFEMDGQVLHSALCTLAGANYKRVGNMGNVLAFRLRKTLR